MASTSDASPQLSQHALTALREFYAEQSEQEKRFENLKRDAGRGPISMNMFSEDWNASQFWNDDETATLLAKELLEGATNDTSIAIVSAPSVYVQVHNALLHWPPHARPLVKLLEFDSRFSVCEGFVHYDFNSPLKLSTELKGNFDRVLCDPPFLSEDCQTKTAMTVEWLSKAARETGKDLEYARVIVCTGERMENLVTQIYPNLQTTQFEPRHSQDRLSNAFRCYTNYESNVLKWR